MPRIYRTLARLLLSLGTASAVAANHPAPADAPYPGTLTLAVDLRDTDHRVFRVQESIPAGAGPLTLLYPKWIPGEHGPTGTIEGISGLVISANGRPVSWRRQLDNMYAVDVDVPADARGVDLSFQFLSPGPGRLFGASVSATPMLTLLEWNQVVFFPAGVAARQVSVAASVAVPDQWHWASALPAAGTEAPSGKSAAAAAGAVRFAPVSLETLVDSPLLTGRYFRRVALADSPVPVNLDLAADRPENLAATDEQIRHQQRLVREAAALFGARHYQHYDFLFVLSELTGHFGLEHHESSDDRLGAEYFTDPEYYLSGGSLLSHEFVHSWNGKFRRPAGLMSPDYGTPMKSDLLWVYEGLTNYYGEVLSARDGTRSPEQFRDVLADTAAEMEYAVGRSWRPLQDTADEAQILYNSPRSWSNWRRGVDFYSEGTLLWLDVDTLIRENSHGERSLDDFARLFFGQSDGVITPQPYDFEDVVAALDRVQHYDWTHFLRTRLDARTAGAPLDGIVRGGWKLVYTDEPNAVTKADEKINKAVNLQTSLGFSVDTDTDASSGSLGTLNDVVWKSPAFEAGLAPGMKIRAVNGTRFSADILKDAVKAGKTGPQAIELLVEDFDQFRSVRIDFHGGLRYPHLARIENSDERLADIVRPRAK